MIIPATPNTTQLSVSLLSTPSDTRTNTPSQTQSKLPVIPPTHEHGSYRDKRWGWRGTKLASRPEGATESCVALRSRSPGWCVGKGGEKKYPSVCCCPAGWRRVVVPTTSAPGRRQHRAAGRALASAWTEPFTQPEEPSALASWSLFLSRTELHGVCRCRASASFKLRSSPPGSHHRLMSASAVRRDGPMGNEEPCRGAL